MKIGFTGTQEGATIGQARALWVFLSNYIDSERLCDVVRQLI